MDPNSVPTINSLPPKQLPVVALDTATSEYVPGTSRNTKLKKHDTAGENMKLSI